MDGTACALVLFVMLTLTGCGLPATPARAVPTPTAIQPAQVVADPLPAEKTISETSAPAPATELPLPPPESAPLTAAPLNDDPYHVPDGTAPKRQPSDTPDPNFAPVLTPTGIPEHVGPHGGIFHYSKTGKKVYEKLSK